MFDPRPNRLRSNSNPARPRTVPAPSNRPPSPEEVPSVPQRPLRNPARPVLPPDPRARPSTSSGHADRRSFWDLSTTLAPLTLAPSAKNSAVRLGAQLLHAQSTDFSLLKRNKSTGSKTPRMRLSPQVAETDDFRRAHAQLVATMGPPPGVSRSPRQAKSPLQTLPEKEPSPLSTPVPPSQLLSRKQKQLQFSTADRTILEELKRSMSAHAAQFVVKGTLGSRHHPYPPDVVPYPRSYTREAVDMDVWETAVCQQICSSLTFHVFDRPPTKVLDIGCGTGTWILDCARTWRSCHFVGLDIVPLHPDLQRVGSSELASRITWVQTNFLEGLPFPNEEFDFVHIKRIARGVPEDKWDPLFEEITRVMKRGGAFEMVEEDLFFPGTCHHPDTDSIATEQQRTPPNMSSTSLPHDLHADAQSRTFRGTARRPPIQRRHTNDPKLSHLPLRSSPLVQRLTGLDADAKEKMQPQWPPRIDHRLLERIYTEMHESRFINLTPLSLLPNLLSVYFKDLRTHAPLQITFPPTRDRSRHNDDDNSDDARDAIHPRHKRSRQSTPTRIRPRTTIGVPHTSTDEDEGWLSVLDLMEGTSPYVSLDTSRLSAYSPSLKAVFLKPRRMSLASESAPTRPIDKSANKDEDEDDSYDTDDTVHAQLPTCTSRLPNPTMKFDLESLNLHLALRTSEMVACAEAMWEWVVEYQKKLKERVVSGGRSRSGSIEHGHVHAVMVQEDDMRAIAEMTRRDFDGLLERFEQDMKHHMSLGSVLEDRLSWTRPASMSGSEEWESYEQHHTRTSLPLPLSRLLRVFAAWKE